MKNKLVVMVGVAGVGKSTFLKKVAPEGNETEKVFSSDDYRVSMYGSLLEGNRHNDNVFRAMHKDLMAFLKTGENKTAYYDATNLIRKRRRALYETFSPHAYIHIIYLYKTLEEILENNSKRSVDKYVPEQAIKRMYIGQMAPRLGVDCDSYKVISSAKVDYPEIITNIMNIKEVNDLESYVSDNLFKEFKLNYTEHNSPYHKESVNEHISMTIENAPDRFLRLVALFHDLGKGIAKTNNEKTGFSQFIGHENIGSIYPLLSNSSNRAIDERMGAVSETILHHMQANRGELTKAIRQDRLSEIEQKRLADFSEVDKKSRKV